MFNASGATILIAASVIINTNGANVITATTTRRRFKSTGALCVAVTHSTSKGKDFEMSKPATSTMPLFPLGLTCATPGALEALSEAEQEAAEFLHRHQSGDWSE